MYVAEHELSAIWCFHPRNHHTQKPHRPPFCSEMRTALAFLASVAAACAFAPTLPSHGRVSLKRTSPVCSAQGSAVLQPFADRRALKVGCGTRGLLRVERA